MGNDSMTNDMSVQEFSEALLLDAQQIPIERSLSMPIAQLSTMGSVVSSLIPALNTATQSLSLDGTGLYRLANSARGDVLKLAKNGNFWGAYKTLDGSPKFVQLAAADTTTVTSKIAAGINPATLMMAVALFAIEQELGRIADVQKQIISFLEIEKESEIEADVISLNELISQYKYNWDNEKYLLSNHKLVCDIKRTARKNMISFQKQAEEIMRDRKLIVQSKQVNTMLSDLLKKFKYFRISLFSFALSSMTEIMLSGNFREDNIVLAINDIEKNANKYRDLFSECSVFLETMSRKSLDTNILKGIGTAGSFIGSAGLVNVYGIKCRPANDFLKDKGERIRANAEGKPNNVILAFSNVSNPNTGMITNKLRELNSIYNHISEICFDRENIYLIYD